MSKQSHLLPTHLRIYEYAKKMDVNRKYVYLAIEDGRILPDLVGKGKTIMIEWEKYKNVTFKDH